ncbi:MAG: DUF1972 domain-containing protein [Deltaproteobacteria bacterium]|nr:DUF1972 domain-containing protein [Deltaproteobacteria bacterium]
MQIAILGTRGIPAKHGGFETFAEHFALYLVDKGWEVSIYCQDEENGDIFEDSWRGVHRVHIPVSQAGAKGTVVFDWKSTWHATARKRPVLTLGYNTAIFCMLYRFHGIYNIINMDGIEWRRAKWSLPERVWLYMNEKLGAWLGNHLIADHPEIKKHLIQFVGERKVTVIPYAADILDAADEGLLAAHGLQKNGYAIIIARPEPENSILEVVAAFSRKKRHMHLAVLGNFSPETNEYHKKVIEAAGDEVKFLGAIYDQAVVQSLRFFARLYIHGHTVGGTNPSLVEALGARSAVLAQNNKFNRWVAGEKARYFLTEDDCARELDTILNDDALIAEMKDFSHQQITTRFTWDKVHKAYEQLLIEAMRN